MPVASKVGVKKLLNDPKAASTLVSKLTATPAQKVSSKIETGQQTVDAAKKAAAAPGAAPYDEDAVKRRLLQNYSARATRGSSNPTKPAPPITPAKNPTLNLNLPKTNISDAEKKKLMDKKKSAAGKTPFKGNLSDIQKKYGQAKEDQDRLKKLKAAAKRRMVKKPVKHTARV